MAVSSDVRSGSRSVTRCFRGHLFAETHLGEGAGTEVIVSAAVRVTHPGLTRSTIVDILCKERVNSSVFNPLLSCKASTVSLGGTLSSHRSSARAFTEKRAGDVPIDLRAIPVCGSRGQVRPGPGSSLSAVGSKGRQYRGVLVIQRPENDLGFTMAQGFRYWNKIRRIVVNDADEVHIRLPCSVRRLTVLIVQGWTPMHTDGKEHWASLSGNAWLNQV